MSWDETYLIAREMPELIAQSGEASGRMDRPGGNEVIAKLHDFRQCHSCTDRYSALSNLQANLQFSSAT